MYQELFDFILSIPQAVANMTSWLFSPLNEKWLNIAPISLLAASGTSFLIAIITIHVIKLFTN